MLIPCILFGTTIGNTVLTFMSVFLRRGVRFRIRSKSKKLFLKFIYLLLAQTLLVCVKVCVMSPNLQQTMDQLIVEYFKKKYWASFS